MPDANELSLGCCGEPDAVNHFRPMARDVEDLPAGVDDLYGATDLTSGQRRQYGI